MQNFATKKERVICVKNHKNISFYALSSKHTTQLKTKSTSKKCKIRISEILVK